LTFIDERTEAMLVREFAKLMGVEEKDVNSEVIDTLTEQGIRLTTHNETPEQSIDAEVYIKLIGKNKFHISGRIEMSGKASKKRTFNQEYTGHPASLPKVLARLLAVVKVRKKGWLPFG